MKYQIVGIDVHVLLVERASVDDFTPTITTPANVELVLVVVG